MVECEKFLFVNADQSLWGEHVTFEHVVHIVGIERARNASIIFFDEPSFFVIAHIIFGNGERVSNAGNVDFAVVYSGIIPE